HGVKARARRDVEDFSRAMLAQQLDEETAFRRRARVPVDEVVPFLDEGFRVFLLVVTRSPDAERIVAVALHLCVMWLCNVHYCCHLAFLSQRMATPRAHARATACLWPQDERPIRMEIWEDNGVRRRLQTGFRNRLD